MFYMGVFNISVGNILALFLQWTTARYPLIPPNRLGLPQKLCFVWFDNSWMALCN
jgi:hypothetical protein